MSGKNSHFSSHGFLVSPKAVFGGFWRRYGAHLVVPVAVAFVSVLVYTIWAYYLGEEGEMTNLDAEKFWKNVHPRLGVSFLAGDSCCAKKTPDVHVRGNEGGYNDHDPRVIPALWLDVLLNSQNSYHLESDHGCVSPDFNITLPFSWGSFLGISSSFQSASILDSSSDAKETPNSQMNNTDDITDNNIDPLYSIPCRISAPMDSPFPAELRKYIGANYMVHTQNIPTKVILLGVIPTQKSQNISPALTINLTRDHTDSLSGYTENGSNMVGAYMRTHPGACEISISDQLEQFREFLSTNSIEDSKFNKNGDFPKVDLVPEEFGPFSSFSNCHHSTSENPQIKTPPKYFHEAELSNTHVGFHYDWRFFKTADFSDYERKVVLHRLAKAWLRFSRSFGLKTWLAHGTLLGWYWNGMNLPWDQDIDVQMMYSSLEILAKTHNQSLVVDLTDELGVAGVAGVASVHSYFVDVSPHYRNRSHKDKKNVVDARFIDTDTGMYVDITGLASTSFEGGSNSSCDVKGGTQSANGDGNEAIDNSQDDLPNMSRLHQVFNSDYRDIVKSASDNPWNLDSLHSELAQKASTAYQNRSLYNCKDFHFYHLSDLTPLIRTSFEGEIAFVPQNFKAILHREYPRGLSSKSHGDWVYRPFFGVWSRFSRCRKDTYGDECGDKDIILEEKYTRPYRLKRGHWDVSVEQSPRVDPFMIRRNRVLYGV